MDRLLFLCFLFLVSSAYSEENFLLINGATNEVVLELGPHLEEQLTPACSFNIALSLMGFESGILESKITPKWDFEAGYPDSFESWRVAQTPQTWMKHSCVWYSQLLAKELGHERLQYYLTLFEYGNHDISGGLTQAWLSSSLKISPTEQVLFIQKMIQGMLPVSAKALELTKALLFKEEFDGWKLYGKTGLGSFTELDGNTTRVVWFVGWIENERLFFPFAYNNLEIRIIPGQSIPRVKELITNVLTEQI